jgi:hypothetical protein
MSRFPQPLCARGSQRWMQWYVNHAPQILDAAIGLGPIDWRSPLCDDEYAEYRDEAFLERLGVTVAVKPLERFWPRGGPRWDALGRATSGEAVIVVAKAHLNELYSPDGHASDASLALTQASLAEAAQAMGVTEGFDWSRQFYQYANRLAHAYFLGQVNGVPVTLVFVYFTGDSDMKGPATRGEWDAAIRTVHAALGLKHHPPFVRDVFLEVRPGPQGPLPA